jgi:hypothetical protein
MGSPMFPVPRNAIFKRGSFQQWMSAKAAGIPQTARYPCATGVRKRDWVCFANFLFQAQVIFVTWRCRMPLIHIACCAACRTVSRFLYPCGRQPFLWAAHYWTALATYPRVKRSGPLLLPYLVLLRVGFTLPAGLLLPRCALTAPFHPYPSGRYIFCGTFRKVRFERTPPAVSRHAALWRPDFPPL